MIVVVGGVAIVDETTVHRFAVGVVAVVAVVAAVAAAVAVVVIVVIVVADCCCW